MTNNSTESNAGQARKLRRWLPWAIVLGILFLWLVVPTAGKMYYDGMVRELCAKDGGVKVYETVALSAERFDQYGNVRIPRKEKMNSTDEYYYIRETTYYRKGQPEIWRNHHKIIRRSDEKLLGESVSYARRGGDPISPMHESSFGCPDATMQLGIEKSIFVKGSKK